MEKSNKLSHEELRAIVIDLVNKNRDKTFAEISKILFEKYGEIRSRQAIQGLYTRAMEKLNRSKEGNQEVLDVLNLKALGYKMSEIEELLEKDHSNLTYYKIRTIIDKNEKAYDTIWLSYETKVIKAIQDEKTLDEIKEDLTYEGEDMQEKQLEILLADAYCKIIKNEAYNRLADLYRLTKKSVVDMAMAKLGFKDGLADIKMRIG